MYHVTPEISDTIVISEITVLTQRKGITKNEKTLIDIIRRFTCSMFHTQFMLIIGQNRFICAEFQQQCQLGRRRNTGICII